MKQINKIYEGARMSHEKIGTEAKRLRILRIDEIEDLYGKPSFTTEERSSFFSLTQSEIILMETFRSTKSKAYFILQLGYFKAKQQFFNLDPTNVDEDLQFILKMFFAMDHENEKLEPLSKKTRIKQQNVIRTLFNFNNCDTKIKIALLEKACKLAAFCNKPIFIFRELTNYLSENHIIIPGYSFMQETVGQAMIKEHNRLLDATKKHLTFTTIDSLQALLDNTQGLYEITQLKREPKDFSFNEIKQEINKGKQISALYKVAQQILPKYGISNENIKYYASLIEYYSVYKLKQLNKWTVYLYLLCYIHDRFQKVHDNLINTLIYSTRRYKNEAKSLAKEEVYELYTQNKQDIKKAGEVLKLLLDESIDPMISVKELRTKIFAILDRSHLENLTNQLMNRSLIDELALQWEFIDKLAPRFKRYLRPILLMVDFSSSKLSDPLIEAIHFLKECFSKNKSLRQIPETRFPTDFISTSLHKFFFIKNLNGEKELAVNRYEFLVYQLLWANLESGDIFCNNSIRFRSFDEDLISNDQWKQKDNLIKNAGLSLLSQPITQHLEALEETLELRIKTVNKHILSKQNQDVKLQGHKLQKKWTLQTKYTENSEPNHSFYDTVKSIEISQLLHYVNQECQFLSVFEHVLGRYTKQKKDNQVLIASLIAWGTNMGLGRMAEISDIDYAGLATTSDNFIRLETLKEANDVISNAIAQLPIFKQYNIDNIIHSSSDGQKFETKIPTFNSRYSSKYFGLDKGVVSYSVVANHIPISAQIIGANEHESHYVFDSLYSNSTTIQPEIHSTDTHGTNEINFAILSFFGYKFAPRYKNIYNTIRSSLYGFNHPSYYEGLLIKPIRKINTELIISEWENIQRIILSLSQKATTQSIIVGKLSTYARKNKTKKALWEYDNILKSLYLLEYIDSSVLRKSVQKALNRGESYHKLRRAVSHANFGKLRFKTEQEQQIWGECARLLTNCIIYYNSSILSYLKTIGVPEELVNAVSPVAWQHINFYGHYQFNVESTTVDIAETVREFIRSNNINYQPGQ